MANTKTVKNSQLRYKLMKCVEEEYSQSKLTDAAFAKKMSLVLGLSDLTAAQVNYIRQVLGVKANHTPVANSTGGYKVLLTEAVTELTNRLADLEKKFQRLVDD
jgi:hypothetical protein